MTEKVSEKKKLLGIDEIVEAQDIQFTEVEVPEWGGTIRLGSLDAGELINFIEANDGPAKRNAGLRLIIKSLVNEDNKRIGTDAHLEHFKKKNAKVCSRLVDEILKLNGLDAKGKDVPKNISGEATSDVSPTVLH
jgi:hypothetical protein